MKQTIKYLFTLLISGVLLAACTETAVEEKGMLEVSLKEGIFNTQTKTIIIDVRTNQKEWNYLIGADWITGEKNGDKLILEASPNNTGTTRYSSVMITAGKLVAHIDLEQHSGQSALSTNKSVYTLGQWSERLTIPIISGNRSWEVTVSEDWLVAIPNLIKGEILVNVSENLSREDRSGIIFVEDKPSGEAISIEVRQHGVLWFILPYVGFDEEIESIKTFEAQRRSVLTSSSDTGMVETWMFETQSPILSRAEYALVNGKLTTATLYGPIHLIRKEADALFNFIEGQGYSEEGEDYVNRQLGVKVRIGRTITGKEVALIFEPIPIQPTPQPSFSTFPLGFAEQSDWQKKGEKEINEWTTKQGFEYSEGLSSEDNERQTKKLTYVSSNDASDIAQMAFFVSTAPGDKTTPIMSIFMTYLDRPELVNKFFWEKNGQYHITNEFLQLARNSGFSYVRKDGIGTHIFENPSTSTLFGVKMIVPGAGSILKPFVMTQVEYNKN